MRVIAIIGFTFNILTIASTNLLANDTPKNSHKIERSAEYLNARVLESNGRMNASHDACVEPANNGDPDCINLLGVYYMSPNRFQGLTIKKDQLHAKNLFERAIKLGNEKAALNLAEWYRNNEANSGKKVFALVSNNLLNTKTNNDWKSFAYTKYLGFLPKYGEYGDGYTYTDTLRLIEIAADNGVIQASEHLYELYTKGKVNIRSYDYPDFPFFIKADPNEYISNQHLTSLVRMLEHHLQAPLSDETTRSKLSNQLNKYKNILLTGQRAYQQARKRCKNTPYNHSGPASFEQIACGPNDEVIFLYSQFVNKSSFRVGADGKLRADWRDHCLVYSKEDISEIDLKTILKSKDIQPKKIEKSWIGSEEHLTLNKMLERNSVQDKRIITRHLVRNEWGCVTIITRGYFEKVRPLIDEYRLKGNTISFIPGVIESGGIDRFQKIRDTKNNWSTLVRNGSAKGYGFWYLSKKGHSFLYLSKAPKRLAWCSINDTVPTAIIHAAIQEHPKLRLKQIKYHDDSNHVISDLKDKDGCIGYFGSVEDIKVIDSYFTKSGINSNFGPFYTIDQVKKYVLPLSDRQSVLSGKPKPLLGAPIPNLNGGNPNDLILIYPRERSEISGFARVNLDENISINLQVGNLCFGLNSPYKDSSSNSTDPAVVQKAFKAEITNILHRVGVPKNKLLKSRLFPTISSVFTDNSKCSAFVDRRHNLQDYTSLAKHGAGVLAQYLSKKNRNIDAIILAHAQEILEVNYSIFTKKQKDREDRRLFLASIRNGTRAGIGFLHIGKISKRGSKAICVHSDNIDLIQAYYSKFADGIQRSPAIGENPRIISEDTLDGVFTKLKSNQCTIFAGQSRQLVKLQTALSRLNYVSSILEEWAQQSDLDTFLQKYKVWQQQQEEAERKAREERVLAEREAERLRKEACEQSNSCDTQNNRSRMPAVKIQQTKDKAKTLGLCAGFYYGINKGDIAGAYMAVAVASQQTLKNHIPKFELENLHSQLTKSTSEMAEDVKQGMQNNDVERLNSMSSLCSRLQGVVTEDLKIITNSQ